MHFMEQNIAYQIRVLLTISDKDYFLFNTSDMKIFTRVILFDNAKM